MHDSRLVLSASVIAICLSLSAMAQEGHQHADHAKTDNGPNGGKVQLVGSTKVETVIQPKGIMFTILDTNGNLQQLAKAGVTPPAMN